MIAAAALLGWLAFAGAEGGRGDPYLTQLVTQARAQDLARAPQWQALLHYHRRWGRLKSAADGLSFFFAGKAGKTDPRRELEATLTAFRAPAIAVDPQHLEESQHPQCRFPARWAFLKTALAIDPARFPDEPCPLYSTWRQAIAAEKITLVYASAYLNSPASMYGHTFLRISRATGEGNPLLDYIVNFAADVTTNNGLLYALNGLTGGFGGHFYVMPYYMKIQEYSHMESRDLWEYALALAPDQVERLVAHTWETRSTYFDYYFFDENCSYFLLELLDAADPSLRLTEHFPAWVIPADTVRAVLAVPGLVQTASSRPSLHAAMMARKAQLGRSEAPLAAALAKSEPTALAKLTPARQAVVLDAAYERLRYTEGGRESPRFLRTERELLVMRGHTAEGPHPLEVAAGVDAPERGHRSLRVGLRGGVRSSDGALGGFQQLDVRIAIHDQLDPPVGYVPSAVLEMLDLGFRLDDGHRTFALDHLTLVNIVSPAPMDSWAPRVSWSARIGGGQERALGCDGWSCLVGGVGAGGGLAVQLGRPLLLYALAESDLGAGPPLAHKYRVGLGGSTTALLEMGGVGRLRLSARYLYYFLGDDRRPLALAAGQAFDLGRRAQLRLVGEAAGRYREGRLELLAYF